MTRATSMCSAAVSAKPAPRVLPPARTQGDLGRAETKIVLLGKPLPLDPAVAASSLLPSVQVNSGAPHPHRSRDGASIRTGSTDLPTDRPGRSPCDRLLPGRISRDNSQRFPAWASSAADGPPTVQRSEAADGARVRLSAAHAPLDPIPETTSV